MRRPSRSASIAFLAPLVFFALVPAWGVPDGRAPERRRAAGGDELAPLGALGEPYRVFLARGEAEFNPQYPLLQYLVQAGFVAPYLVVAALSGEVEGLSAEYPFGLRDPPSAFWWLTVLARVPSLLMAAATVLMVFLLGRFLWTPRAGAFAAIGAGSMLPLIYYSRTSNVDAPALFWTVLALLFTVRIVESGRGLDRTSAVALGAVAALAIATKDAAYAPLLAMGAAALAVHVRRSVGRGRWGGPALALSVAIALYALASGLAFDPERYLAHIDFVLHGGAPGLDAFGRPVPSPFYGRNPASVAGYLAFAAELGLAFVDSVGWPILVAGLVGWARFTERGRWLVWIAAATVVGVCLPVRFVELRFVLFPALVLALFAGPALDRLWRASWPLSLGPVLVVAVLGLGALRAADFTWQMHRDSRTLVEPVLAANLRQGEAVGFYGSVRKLPRLPAGVSTEPMPGQRIRLADASGNGRPEFVLVIPQQSFEPEHEWTLPESGFRSLIDGSAGYTYAVYAQTPSLFRRRPISFVNPPVRLFVRDDLLPRAVDARGEALTQPLPRVLP